MQANANDWDEFYNRFLKQTGLDLRQYKQDQLQRRIASMAESKACVSLEQFWSFLLRENGNVQWFQDRLAINVSELFRNPEKWRDLQEKLLPELIGNGGRLRAWSAGCSYGAEAHTLAMILDAKFPGSHEIVGTDIDEAALKQARAGEFNEQDLKAVPKEYLPYLHRSGTGYVADVKLKRYLKFQNMNLLTQVPTGSFDLILCRNVVIYFTDAAKEELYKRFFAALKPGGYLFVGSTERIFNANSIGFDTPMPFFYRKPNVGDKVWRNAS